MDLKKGLAVLAVALVCYELYSKSWRAAISLSGTYERRQPGEFAKDQERYAITSLSNSREFQYLPPAPQKPGLIKFTSPHAGDLYVDGLRAAAVRVGTKGGCAVVQIGDVTLVKTECPV